MAIRIFCDACGKELTRNMTTERLIVESGKFKAEVIVSKVVDGLVTTNAGDLCYDCLVKMLNEKPKRKYTRKQASEHGKVLPDTNAINTVPETIGTNIPAENVGSLEQVAQSQSRTKFYIHAPTGQPGDVEYQVNIAGRFGIGTTLKAAVVCALGIDDIPDTLSEPDRKLIQDITEVKTGIGE